MGAITENSSLLVAFATVFPAGFLAGLSPCSLPTVLLVAGFVTGRSEKTGSAALAVAFVLGIVTMLTALGAAAGGVGILLLDSRFLDYGIAVVFILMGLWLMKVIDIDVNSSWAWIKPGRGSGLLGAFLLGLPFGVAASPCTLPVTASILAYSSKSGSAALGALLLAVYATGRSIPLLLVGTSAPLLTRLQRWSRFQPWFERIAGVTLIVLAGYLILTA
jgi:cytochrome c-type biogenesis protein